MNCPSCGSHQVAFLRETRAVARWACLADDCGAFFQIAVRSAAAFPFVAVL